jgi:microcystin-dependent protein
MDPYVGEIRCFGFNFAPVNWAFCNGQLMSIAQNTALFAILGTTYGGNGQTTFALPNLQGRSPMQWGTSPGFNTVIGEPLGTPSVTLTTTQIPAHTHTISAVSVPPDGTPERSPDPKANSYLAEANAAAIYQKPTATPDTPFNAMAMSANGNSLPHENTQPYLTLNFCISLFGVFPSRN